MTTSEHSQVHTAEVRVARETPAAMASDGPWVLGRSALPASSFSSSHSLAIAARVEYLVLLVLHVILVRNERDLRWCEGRGRGLCDGLHLGKVDERLFETIERRARGRGRVRGRGRDRGRVFVPIEQYV